MNFGSVPDAENYGQLYGSFSGPNMLMGEMRRAEGGPFAGATASITLAKE